jgi:hypothetical protein
VRDLHHQVLASGWFTDERAAALKLYEESSDVASAEGARMQETQRSSPFARGR